MSQDTFNKLVTITLLSFFMAMYVVSFVTGKNIDWTQLLAFAVPTINHIVHQITQAQLVTKNIDADTTKTVAQVQAVTNGNTQSTARIA